MTGIDAAVFNTYILLSTSITVLLAITFYYRVEQSLRGVLAGVTTAALLQVLTKNVLLAVAAQITATSLVETVIGALPV